MGAREIRLPWALARAIPALTRALLSARSHCAREAIPVKIRAPCGGVVAMGSCEEMQSTPRLCNSCQACPTACVERANRS